MTGRAERRHGIDWHGFVCPSFEGDLTVGNLNIPIKKLKVRITFTEEILGTASSDPNIHERFIASKAPDHVSLKEEIESLGVEEVTERGKTVFSKMEDGTPHLWDYQLKGFFKDACYMLKKVSGTESSKMKTYKKDIDGLIFVEPRKIPLYLPLDVDLSDTDCQRPLRASTPQGERVALAHSEAAPAGTWFEATIMCFNSAHMKAVKEWLDYGVFRGIGQWRNSGKGRFTYEILSEE
jgi:hypothetical protein